MTTHERARETLRRWRADPANFVRENFNVEPDPWQLEALALFPKNNRIAMKACKGPGKTATLAWMILNFLATRPHPKIGCTSITGDNLSMNLWPELSKWLQRSQYLRETFEWTASAIKHRQHPETWFAQARTWPKKANADQQADALAGLHADYAMWVLDESGGIPVPVMATAEAILASGIETKVVQSGNPTHLSGALYRACVTDARLWKVVTITGDPDDPKRSSRISLKWANEEIEKYGRDNPWVMVNVLGKFPPSDINSLLGIEDVEAAMARILRPESYNWSQKRLGIDVARFGDDRSVIFPRQGACSFPPAILRIADTVQIAARAARAQDRWGAELTLIDDTGHWGHGVSDNLRTAGRPTIPIQFHAPANDRRYKNMRSEMWFLMAEWVKGGGKLPKVDELKEELTAPTYTLVGGQLALEPKDMIKARLGKSPDIADALCLTFAIPDMPAEMMVKHRLTKMGRNNNDFDPYAAGGHADFDPWK